MFKVANWQWCDEAPPGLRWLRCWDLAGTKKKQGNDPDWTASVLIARDKDGFTYIADGRRIRGEQLEVYQFMQNVGAEDVSVWGTREVRVPQDPGQAGKGQAGQIQQEVLPTFKVTSEGETGPKETRAAVYASKQQARGVFLVAPPRDDDGEYVRPDWRPEFVEEHRTFPQGKHDDYVDCAANGYMDRARFTKKRASLLDI